MKKINNLFLTSALLFGSFLYSCGNTNDTTITFTLNQVPNVTYGASLDFSQYIVLGSGVVAQYSLTSLTPETVTINESNQHVEITGVGECKVEVKIGGFSQVATFTSYPLVSSISLNENELDLTVGDVVNLEDIVNVNVSNPVGATSSFVAFTSDTDVVEISSDYKSFTCVGTGSFLIEIKDISQKENGYLSGKVVSKLQRDIASLASTFKNNYVVYSIYENEYQKEFSLIHSDKFVAFPYGFLLGTSWQNKYFIQDYNYIYWGYAEYSSGALYEFTSTYEAVEDTSELPFSIENLKYGSKFGGSKEENVYFESFESSYLLNSFKIHKDANKNEDYIYASSSDALYENYFSKILGINISTGYRSFNYLTVKKIDLFGKEALELEFLKDEDSDTFYKFAITSLDKTYGQDFVTYLNNPFNLPPEIDYSPITTYFEDFKKKRNYTVTGEVYFIDEKGNKLSVEEVTELFEPLHTYMMGFKTKYTDDAYLSTEIIRWKGVSGASFTRDRTQTLGYINKTDGVHQVKVGTTEISESTTEIENTTIDENDNVTYNDLSLGETSLSSGSYLDLITSMNNINTAHLTSLDYLSYDEDAETNNKTFAITSKPSEANATTLLRVLTASGAPDMTTKFFPDKGSNDYEVGYYGDGTIVLKDDGFDFTYKVSAAVESASYIICIESHFSDIGTTTIDEYKDL